jgi:hypothetical protein
MSGVHVPNSSYFPTRDSLLVTWANTFASVLSASPATYNSTAAIATAFQTVANDLASAYETCMEPATRTKGTIAQKNQARQTMKFEARKIVRAIYANPPTDQQLIDIGLRPYDVEPTPVPVPDEAPLLEIANVFGRSIRVNLKDVTGESRGRPQGVAGAQLFSFVGNNPPAGEDAWRSEGNVMRNTILVEFPETVPAGAKVWFTACWFNPRGLTGPACTPVVSAIGYEGAMPLAG